MAEQLEQKFEVESKLKDFLQSAPSHVRRGIKGKSLFRWHCGQRKLVIGDYNILKLIDKTIATSFANNHYYCAKCGDNTSLFAYRDACM